MEGRKVFAVVEEGFFFDCWNKKNFVVVQEGEIENFVGKSSVIYINKFINMTRLISSPCGSI